MSSVKRSNLFFMIVLIVMIAGSTLLGAMKLSSQITMVTTEYMFLLVPVIIYFIVTKLPVKETMSFHRLGIKNVLMVLMISLFSMPLVLFIGYVSSLLFHNYLGDAMASFSSMPLIGWIAVIGITPAICEEAVMRGVVLGGYKNINIKKAALMNGLLFGIFHLNFNQFFYAFVLGVIMAYLVYITKSIFSSILMHFTINTISAVSNWRVSKISQDIPNISDLNMATKIQTTMILFILAAIGTFFMIKLIKKLKKMNLRDGKLESENSLSFNENRNENRLEEKTKIFDLPIIISIIIFVLFAGGAAFLVNSSADVVASNSIVQASDSVPKGHKVIYEQEFIGNNLEDKQVYEFTLEEPKIIDIHVWTDSKKDKSLKIVGDTRIFTTRDKDHIILNNDLQSTDTTLFLNEGNYKFALNSIDEKYSIKISIKEIEDKNDILKKFLLLDNGEIPKPKENYFEIFGETLSENDNIDKVIYTFVATKNQQVYFDLYNNSTVGKANVKVKKKEGKDIMQLLGDENEMTEINFSVEKGEYEIVLNNQRCDGELHIYSKKEPI